ncbi:hypothetical protein A0256_19310 [Mucilaginibacter sp. PAMC 26640]|nr:hypothetical protein A0256_19310 [Mucilaginibacter sp. PAMC 26640]
MVKTILTPKDRDISIHIPESYVGKQIEIVLYALDEVKSTQSPAQVHVAFRGALKLSVEEHADLQQHLKDIRNEWNNDI